MPMRTGTARAAEPAADAAALAAARLPTAAAAVRSARACRHVHRGTESERALASGLTVRWSGNPAVRPTP